MTLSPHHPEILHRRCRKRKPAEELKIACSNLQGIIDRKECARFRGSAAGWGRADDPAR